ncbi:hypothetical protein V5T82_15345 [Magnetovibrio sp. PR-2]|uniref:hypothetical protein n=1 Tax=Magnetovibrio sp. PR-2 TaxID=3120356 RepID=UPI002FCE3BD8
MGKSQNELEKIIAEADKAIASAEEARGKKRDAEQELKKHHQRTHLDRLYGIGRVVYEIGLDSLEDTVIAGILLRGAETMQKDQSRTAAFQRNGESALAKARKPVPLEVLIPDRPGRSISAILREAGLKKSKDITRDGKRWTRYQGNAIKTYLERRLTGTDIIIQVVTS